VDEYGIIQADNSPEKKKKPQTVWILKLKSIQWRLMQKTSWL